MEKAKSILMTFLVLLPGIMLNGQINTEKFRKDHKGDSFEVKWGLSLALYKGNTDLFRVETDLNISYYKGKNYIFLLGNITYGEKKKKSYINKGFAHLRGIRRLSDRFMFELFVQEEFDKFILLNRRTLIGGGIRTLIYKYKKGDSGIAINTGIGFMFEKERFDEPGEAVKKADTSMFKSTNYISVNYIINKLLRAGNLTYLQFNTGHLKSTRIYSDLNLDIKLSKVLGYNAKLNYRYDNNPPPTVKKYDIQIKNGLTLKL